MSNHPPVPGIRGRYCHARAYLDTAYIANNIRERGYQNAVVTIATDHPPYVCSEQGLTIHRVHSVRLDWIDPTYLSSTLVVFVCGDATFRPQFFKRPPSKRQRPFLRRCKVCFP